MYFLQFGIWGCYLTCFGQLLGVGGLGQDIAWFYAAIGVVSLISPAVMGYVSDRMISPSRLLSICHILASATMLGAWCYASSHQTLDFKVFYPIYLLFLLFYMPTLALSNTTAFRMIHAKGHQPVDVFPTIRIWGTVGFVAAMWFVNSAYWYDGAFGFTLSDAHPYSHFRFQYTPMQLLTASVFGLVCACYAITLKIDCDTKGLHGQKQNRSIYGKGVLAEFFSKRETRIFLVFAALSGVCLQISNGFATPFITHFAGVKEYANTLAAGNATMLFSLSQISEGACVLLVGLALRKWSIRVVFAMGLIAWALRYFLFAFGNPGDGLWMLVMSMIVYGLAFNFLTIAGHLYIEQQSSANNKGLGQGVMMLMSNGIGASAGTLVAGMVINHWCSWESVTTATGNKLRLFMGDWETPWIIFAIYSLVIAIVFYLCFSQKKDRGEYSVRN
ncbi:MAG: MFS transporter [Muribaculaceae bacterium]|nr:MFS transporter [Muribaculaceae bacterium]